MKPNKNICVRLERDEAQIRRCKERVTVLDGPVSAFAHTLKLAGNAVRLKILWLLNEEGRLCVCDLADILDMTVPAVSQHLKKMREGGLIDREQEGVTIYYFLSPPARPLLHALFEWVPTGEESKLALPARSG